MQLPEKPQNQPTNRKTEKEEKKIEKQRIGGAKEIIESLIAKGWKHKRWQAWIKREETGCRVSCRVDRVIAAA